MRIIQLDLVKLSEFGPVISVFLLVPSNDVTQRSRTEKVLLFQSQLLSCLVVVVRVEHARDVLGLLPLSDCSKVVSLVELVKVKLICGSGTPKSQIVRVVSVVSRDRSVVSLSYHCLAAEPLSAFHARRITVLV